MESMGLISVFFLAEKKATKKIKASKNIEEDNDTDEDEETPGRVLPNIDKEPGYDISRSNHLNLEGVRILALPIEASMTLLLCVPGLFRFRNWIRCKVIADL